ncbi:MAG: arginine decarboxylase [Chloroflexota bacterium]
MHTCPRQKGGAAPGTDHSGTRNVIIAETTPDEATTRPEFHLDQTRAPLVEALAAYRAANITPFSTPGHKLGAGIAPELRELYGIDALRSDIPVSGGVDDIHFRRQTLRQAEELGAAAWGADRSFYLVNGSSTGNHAFLLGTLRPGDKVIVARDLHKSLLVALIHTGAVPVYVAPRLHPELNIGLGIDPGDVGAVLDAHPDAKLVALVSPSYCGIASDVRAIVAVAHRRGIPVYVDEAWGPHFPFHAAFPPAAMASGADGAVVSTHKMLGSITQSAILHVKGSLIDLQRIETAVGMAQTTSPAAFILASIDACRRQMVLYGRDLLERTLSLAHEARERLTAIPGISVLDGDGIGAVHWDPTQIMIDVHALGLTGFAVETLLREQFRIVPEMSDLLSIKCLITIGDTPASIDRLVTAFASIAAEHGQHRTRDEESELGAHLRSSGAVLAPGEQAMSPREAFFAPSRVVPLAEAVGKVSAELVIPYPPGIPVLAPGDVISPEKVEYLQFGAAQGMYISGAADHRLATIRVVELSRSTRA